MFLALLAAIVALMADRPLIAGNCAAAMILAAAGAACSGASEET
jgi:hypothetical protein